MTPERLDKMAEEVVGVLGLRVALKDYDEQVHTRLLQANTEAEAAPMNGDMIFIALALPMVNGLIHFASSRAQLKQAVDVIKDDWKVSDEADPLSTLSALTLIDIVNQALLPEGRSSRHPEERATWREIRGRIERFKRDLESK